jgi:hypothetical protein
MKKNTQKEYVGNSCLERQVGKHTAETGKGNIGRELMIHEEIYSFHIFFIQKTHLPRPYSFHQGQTRERRIPA